MVAGDRLRQFRVASPYRDLMLARAAREDDGERGAPAARSCDGDFGHRIFGGWSDPTKTKDNAEPRSSLRNAETERSLCQRPMVAGTVSAEKRREAAALQINLRRRLSFWVLPAFLD